MNRPKILLFDIENSPHEGYTWGTWEQNVIEVTQPAHLLSVAWKWLGDKSIQVRSLRSYPGYRKDMRDDRALTEEVHQLFSSADIVVAHNAKGHDVPFLNWRFMTHKLSPVSAYQVVDTLQVRKSLVKGKSPSNSLNAVSKEQGYGEKIKHPGFELWTKCLKGDPAAWKLMETYNKHDVELLEAAYLDLRGWMKNHPRIAPRGEGRTCPTCAGVGKSKGRQLRDGRVYRIIQCHRCGCSWKGEPIIEGEL